MPVHVSPQKALQNSQRQTSINEWKKFHRYKELWRKWVKGSTDVWFINRVWEIPKESVHVQTPTLSFSFKICQWFLFRQWLKRKRKIRKGHLLWIWETVLLLEGRNSGKKLRNKKTFLVWQHNSCTLGCAVWVREISWHEGTVG